MIKTWFPTSIYQVDLNPSEDIVFNMLKSTSKIDKDEKSITGDLNNNYTLHNHKSFEWLNSQISIHCKKYLTELGCNISVLNFYAQKSWAVICKQDGYIPKHIHPNSVLSAVFYLMVDESSSPLNFYTETSPYIGLPLVYDANQYTFDVAQYHPIENRLIIFPSNIPHSVMSSNQKGKRISITYDITVTCDKIYNSESMILDPSFWKKL